MMRHWLTIATITFAYLSTSIIADDACRYVDPARGVIDLTSLGRTDGQAAYPDISPPFGSNYSTTVFAYMHF